MRARGNAYTPGYKKKKYEKHMHFVSDEEKKNKKKYAASAAVGKFVVRSLLLYPHVRADTKNGREKRRRDVITRHHD